MVPSTLKDPGPLPPAIPTASPMPVLSSWCSADSGSRRPLLKRLLVTRRESGYSWRCSLAPGEARQGWWVNRASTEPHQHTGAVLTLQHKRGQVHRAGSQSCQGLQSLQNIRMDDGVKVNISSELQVPIVGSRGRRALSKAGRWNRLPRHTLAGSGLLSWLLSPRKRFRVLLPAPRHPPELPSATELILPRLAAWLMPQRARRAVKDIK